MSAASDATSSPRAAMRFPLVLCAIGTFVSWFGLYAQASYYLQGAAVVEVGKLYAIVTDDPQESRLDRLIPDAKSAAIVKSAFAFHREVGQQMADTVSMRGARLKDRALWDAGLWALQFVLFAIVFKRLDDVRRGKRDGGT